MTEVLLVPRTVVLASQNNIPNKVVVCRANSTEDRWTLPSAVTEGSNAVCSLAAFHGVLDTLRLRGSREYRLWWNTTNDFTTVPIFLWRVFGEIDPAALSLPAKWFDIRQLYITEEESQSPFVAGDDLLLGMFRLKQEHDEVDSTWLGDFAALRQNLRERFHPNEFLEELWLESEDRP